VSWAAHDLEPYLLKAKLGVAISIPFCLLGSYSPDILTKWAVYGLDFSGHAKLVDDPVQLHRGWPGFGFTHTLAFGLVIGLIIWLASKNMMWTFSFVIGEFAHVLSDTLDSVGVMLFFPFSTFHVHFGAWQYVGEAGRQLDGIAYYTSLGGAWDIFWAVFLLFNWRVLTTRYYLERVEPKDRFWPWLQGKTNHTMCLVVYRTSAFFGFASIIGWLVYALVVNELHDALDWSWGGPTWAPRVGPPQ
jgi:membrane-bound metal-dependent hydrolase YbcI (DUF457 family)